MSMYHVTVADITIPVPWGHISARTYGDKKNAPVLCVHGRGDNLESFRFLVPMLPKNHYYVCIDLPGHGKSTHAERGYILDQIWYISCIKKVIDYFRWDKVHFIGHSSGANLGVLLASFYPEIVSKLVIIESALLSYVPASKTSRGFRNFLFDPTLKMGKNFNAYKAPGYSLNEFIEKAMKVRNTEISADKIKVLVERNLTKVGPDQYKNSNDQRCKFLTLVHFTVDQLEYIAGDIKCPTLVILGEQFSPPLTRVPNSPLQKINNVAIYVVDGDHDLHLARPHTVAQYVVPFLLDQEFPKGSVEWKKSKL